MRINSNITAYITNNALLRNENNFGLSTEKLSSGYKINKAGDDPTGYAISNRMRLQLAALDSAEVNATTGKSALETADAALTEVTNMIQRMNELAVKAANGTLSPNDRQTIQDEVDQLTKEIDRITDQTELNERKLLDGSMERTGYCTNNPLVKIDSYSDATRSGGYTLSNISETVSGNTLTVTVAGFPTSTDSVTMTYEYPKYYDEQKPSLNGSNVIGTAVTTGLYKDSAGRGSVKICADGSQYITVNGTDGESLTLFLAPTAINTTDVVENRNGVDYAKKEYSVNIPDAKIDLTGKGEMLLQVGANEEQKIKCTLPKITLERLDIDDIDMTTAKGATAAIEKLTTALAYVNEARSTIGAYQNRVEMTLSYLASNTENLNSALSRIKDTDMADEMTNYANQQILVQAATSMLAQANQAPQEALQLLQ